MWLQDADDDTNGDLARVAERLDTPEDLWRLVGEQEFILRELVRRGSIESARVDNTRAWLYGVQQDILCRVTWPVHDESYLKVLEREVAGLRAVARRNRTRPAALPPSGA